MSTLFNNIINNKLMTFLTCWGLSLLRAINKDGELMITTWSKTIFVAAWVLISI